MATALLLWLLFAGVPPKLAAMSLAYNVNLFGSLTHYASGQAAVGVAAKAAALRMVKHVPNSRASA